MQELFGSHWLLANTSLWLSAGVMTVFFMMFNWVGRMIFEGVGYNTSFSSQIGDLFLIAIILIGALVLQRHPMLPQWTTHWVLHAIYGMVTLLVAVCAVFVEAPMIVDKIHNFVIVPLFTYFLLSLAPIIFFGSTGWEFKASLGCLGVWGLLLHYDAKTGRLPQQEFLYKNYGIKLPAWEGKFDWAPRLGDDY